MKKVLSVAAFSVMFAGCSLLPGQSTEAPVETPDAAMVEETTEQAMMVMEVPEGATAYKVDIEKSTVAWTGNMGPKSHTGEVPVSEGQLYMTEDGMIGGEVILDMANFTGDGDAVVTHLKSEDFFAVEAYPTAKLEIVSAEETKDGVYEVVANLTIKGTTEEIEFEATVVDDSEEMATFQASFEFDRAVYDVQFGSASFFEDLGDKVIDDMVPVEVSLVVNK